MCGITACAGTDDVVEELLVGLQNQEYRGYDSSGIAVTNGTGLSVEKREGGIDQLVQAVGSAGIKGTVGIGHTRWSTHGPPSDVNAHPHVDCSGRVAVVHNGIIENHDALRRALRDRGHEFRSETDTEVIPHLVAEAMDAGRLPAEALREATGALEGSYAIAMVVDGVDEIYGARRGSPLVVGLTDGETFLASDVPSFLEFTKRVVHLEDGDVVTITSDGYEVTDQSGEPVDRSPESVGWDPQDAARAGYDHYMLKEIHEQPDALGRAVRGRVEDGEATLDEVSDEVLAGVDEVHFVAAGTSYHASLYAQQLLLQRDVPARAVSAGEYVTSTPPLSSDTLVVAVTQSGETADTLESLRHAKRAGGRTLAVTNVVGSTAARECDEALFIRAGPEIGVAATKTFSSQIATLALLADRLRRTSGGGGRANDREVLEALERLPGKAESLLAESPVEGLAGRYAERPAYFFVGRGLGYPVALEGALKFKEITYEHAEGFAAGDLKHGPLALVTPDTPVVAVFTGRHVEKTLNNVEEVQARGAPVIGVGGDDLDAAAAVVDEYVPVPVTHPDLSGTLVNIQLQRFSYHVARILGRSIDKPRNLAKSVTVQ